MKKLPLLLLALTLLAIIPACSLDPEKDTWEYYEDWRNANNEWLDEQAARVDENGNLYYNKYIADFDDNAYVLMRFLNDRSLTANNLSPKYTSTCDVKYIGRNYLDEAFDSSFTQTANGDSIYRVAGLSGVITGWAVALQNMHVGDSVEVIVPYSQGYGSQKYGDILPYSHLKFNIKLVDIPAYESTIR